MKKQKKIKTLVFRRETQVIFDPEVITDKEAERALINQALEKGYVPLNPTIKDYGNGLKIAHCLCAYAGKKQAKEIGVIRKKLDKLKFIQ